MARVVTLLGGESTGKTTLARTLVDTLTARGMAVNLVPEHLREWCSRLGRAPQAHEQAELAHEQAQRIDRAAADPAVELVIADTAPLVIAAYSELYFHDRSLFSDALDWHQRVDLTLLTGLDLPWVPDGLFRDSPAVRDATDAVLRRELHGASLAFQTVYGQGDARAIQAQRSIGRLLGQDLTETDPTWTRGRRAWTCESCGDSECEHRLFTGLLNPNAEGKASS